MTLSCRRKLTRLNKIMKTEQSFQENKVLNICYSFYRSKLRRISENQIFGRVDLKFCILDYFSDYNCLRNKQGLDKESFDLLL